MPPLTASTQILWLENTIFSHINCYSFVEKLFSIYSHQWNKWAFMQISRFYSAWRWQLLCNAHERCVIYWQVLNFKQFVSRGLKLSIFRVQVFPLSSMNFWAKQIDLNHLEIVKSSVWVRGVYFSKNQYFFTNPKNGHARDSRDTLSLDSNISARTQKKAIFLYMVVIFLHRPFLCTFE